MTIPRLEGYFTVPEAAERLGMTRQYIHVLVKTGAFQGVRQAGTVNLIPESEVERMLAERQREQDAAGTSDDVHPKVS